MSTATKKEKSLKDLKTEKEALALVKNYGYKITDSDFPEKLKTEAVCKAAYENCENRQVVRNIPKQFRTFSMVLKTAPEYGTDTKEYAWDVLDKSWGISDSAFVQLVKKGTLPNMKKVPEALKEEVGLAVWKKVLNDDITEFGNAPENLAKTLAKGRVRQFAFATCYNGYSSRWIGKSMLKYILEKEITDELVEDFKEKLKGELKNKITIEGIPERFLDGEIYLESVIQGDERSLSFIPEDMITKKMCEIAVNKNGKALNYVPEDMKKSFYIDVVKSGKGFDTIPEEDRTDKLCTLAVETNASEFKFVPEEKKTYSLCLLAVDNNMEMIEKVPENLLDEEIMVRALISFLKLGDNVRNSYASRHDEILNNALESFVKHSYSKDREFKKGLLLQVVERDSSVFKKLVDQDFSGNKIKAFNEMLDLDICVAAFKKDSKVLMYIPLKFSERVWKSFTKEK